MEKLRNHSLEFIYKVWKNDCDDSSLNIDNKRFEKKAEEVFLKLTENHKSSVQPILVKLGGQSGSGKTTQLLPSIAYGLEKNNIDFVHLAVRKFAEYHPHYNELLNSFGRENIREKTNGFALTLLFRVFEKLIENSFNIFFEVTLLEPDFEEYMIKLAKKYNYYINYNILAIPFSVSNAWIKMRENDATSEENKRIVLKSSSDYFYNSLPIALERIIKLKNLFTEKDSVIIWNYYLEKPIFEGEIKDEIMDVFNNSRETKNISEYDKNILLQKKQKFYKEFFSIFLKKF